MRRNILLIISLVILQNINAQIVSTYTIKAPLCKLEKDAKVFVEGFKYSGTETGDEYFSENLSNNIKNNLTQGFGASVLSMIPWANNKLYTLVQSADEATYIVYGDFNHSASKPAQTCKTDKAVVSDAGSIGLYVHYLTFIENANISFIGNLKVKKVGAADIYLKKFEKSKKASQKSQFVPNKKPLDIKASISALGREVANSGSLYAIMGLRVYNQKYKLKKIKIQTKDKAAKKKIKTLVKTVSKSLKNNSYNAKEAGRYLLEIAALEKSSAVLYNIGICYSAIGNYTKAKDYYVQSGIGSNIDQLIDERSKLENLGIEVIENNF